MTSASHRVTGEDMAGKDRQFVAALARGLEILRAFRPGEMHLGNRELALRTGLPRPTVSRLTYTLTELGYLVHDRDYEKYRLGSAALTLGFAALATMDFRHVARRFMQEIADFSKASVSLGERNGTELIYIENCRGTGGLTLGLDVGARVPIASTAMGRALIAALDDVARVRLLDRLRGEHAGDWPRLKAGIEQAMRDYAERGFTASIGDWQPEIHAVGVAIVVADGRRIYGLNCGGAAFALTRERLESEIGPRLVEAARHIEMAVRRG
jgi:DNA-binding IclR family transcriptional regulator